MVNGILTSRKTKMKKFRVTFQDVIEAETEEQAYDEMIKYCFDVHNNEDVTAFNFEEINE